MPPITCSSDSDIVPVVHVKAGLFAKFPLRQLVLTDRRMMLFLQSSNRLVPAAPGGLHREALDAEPKVFGRYEAEAPNDRWITDVLVGPWVPWPRIDASVRAKLFLIVDDHSRLIVDGRFFVQENTPRSTVVRPDHDA